MIYTLTLNPSLDYVAYSNTFNIGKTNRTSDEYFVAGGKGLNVSILLSRLGEETTAFGFVGGFTGDELCRQLENEKINCDFTKVDGNTRINVKLQGYGITEFNASGVSLSEKDIAELKTKLQTLNSGDWLCLSGSIPKGMGNDIYLTLAKCVKEGVKVVVDATGEPLKEALKAKPFLIKPNFDELCDLLGYTPKTYGEIAKAAEELQKAGAQNVLVSLGGDGALLFDQNGEINYKTAPEGEIINTVGAGDSMIAGFIHRYIKTEDFADSLNFAIASGSATAFSPWLAEKSLIEELYK